MATKYLDRGAITATGTYSGANPATGDDLIVNDDFGPLVNDIASYGAQDLESYVYKPGAVGRMGGDGAGSFTCPISNTSDAKLVMEGTDVWHYQGASVDNAHIARGNRLFQTAGTVGTATQVGGEFWAASGAVVTNFYGVGGKSDHAYNATAGTTFKATSGTHNIRREYASIKVAGDAHVIIDLDTQITVDSATELHIDGGKVTLINGAIPIVYLNAGELDCTQASRSFELGATTLEMLGTKVKDSPLVEMTNQSSPGAMDRPVSGPILIS